MREGLDAWIKLAACRNKPTRVFFPSDEAKIMGQQGGKVRDELYEEALFYCQRCPVVDHCLKYAMVHRMEWGIWGNTRPLERKQMFRNKNKQQERNT